jgi:hypothetical protein
MSMIHKNKIDYVHLATACSNSPSNIHSGNHLFYGEKCAWIYSVWLDTVANGRFSAPP